MMLISPFLVTVSPSSTLSDKDFERIKRLGNGTFGAVFLVRKRGGEDDNQLYALKVQKIQRIVKTPKTIKHAKWERLVRRSNERKD